MPASYKWGAPFTLSNCRTLLKARVTDFPLVPERYAGFCYACGSSSTTKNGSRLPAPTALGTGFAPTALPESWASCDFGVPDLQVWWLNRHVCGPPALGLSVQDGRALGGCGLNALPPLLTCVTAHFARLLRWRGSQLLRTAIAKRLRACGLSENPARTVHRPCFGHCVPLLMLRRMNVDVFLRHLRSSPFVAILVCGP